jgi:addiction module HigA family antidote
MCFPRIWRDITQKKQNTWNRVQRATLHVALMIGTAEYRLNMPRNKPPHPGQYVLEDCIKPLGLTVTEAAEGLGVTRNTLSRLINGRNGVSPEMAVRLSKAFGSTPEMWLRLQTAYELAQVQEKSGTIRVKRLFAAADAAESA